MSKKYTLEQVRDITKIHNFELISDEYLNNNQKLILKDEDGYYYTITLSGLLRGNPYKFHIQNEHSLQNMKLWLQYNSDLKLVTEEFISLRYKYVFKDSNNYYYKTAFANLLSGKHPCKFDIKNPYTIQNINLFLKLNNKNIKLLSDKYDGYSKYLKWQCLINNCMESFNMSLSDLVSRNCGCPYCSSQKVGLSNCLATTHLEITKEWHPTLNGDLTPYDVTCGSGKYAWFLCNKCNYEWNTKINYRNDGCGCPQCSESKGEKQLDFILSKYNIPHISQYTFDNLIGVGGGLLRFDKSVFWDKEKTQLRMLIEYDGIQHFKWIEGMMSKEQFKTLQIHDELKNKYCNKHSILLIRIPYWDFDNIEEILLKELKINSN